jgi:isopentenyl phosphate kinase
LPTAQVRTLLSEGFVPVLHGDLVAHAGEGATVLSGDELVVELAPAVGADRVGVCSTVPGVLDEVGEVVERIEAFEDVAAALGGSDATDVSGGMAAKVHALLELDARAQVFGPDALADFLAGESPGTTIGGGSRDASER